MRKLSYARAKELFEYNPKTGDLIWKVTSGNGRVKAGQPVRTQNGHGYYKIGLDRKNYCAHRVAWLLYHGSWPKTFIHHINGNGLDNRIENLEYAHRAHTPGKRNKSGYSGISFHKASQKWYVKINVRCKVKYLGVYEHLEDAVKARNKAEKKYRSVT